MFVTTITVDAHQTMTDAAARLEGLPDDAYVVVRRRAGLELFFYAYRAGFLRDMTRRDGTGLVIDVLNLHESGASPTAQLSAAPPVSAGATVLLDGDTALGIQVDDLPASRGDDAEAPPPPPPPAPSASPPSVSPPSAPPSSGGISFGPGIDLEELTASPEPSGAPAPDPAVGAPAPAPGPAAPAPAPATPFTAHPQLDCPSQVAVGEVFDVVVRLSPAEATGTVGGPVVVDTQLAEFDLVVSLVADGFTRDRTRDVLHVVRSDPSAHEVRFRLSADRIEDALRPAMLQVDFAFGGVLCGRAWRALVVTAEAAADIQTVAGAVTSAPASADPSATPILVLESERPPDLVITLTENDDSTQLVWHFTTPHDGLTLPTAPVRHRFEKHNAKSFAMQQVRLIHESIGSAAVGNRLLGIARTIADQVPPEAWQALSQVWQRTTAQGRRPSVLLVSTDAYVPWELASTEAAYVDGPVTDATVPPFLGAQACVSRWVAPQPRGASGVLNPTLPPPESLDVDTMVLVIGDYLAENGLRPLPKAIEEGNELAAFYRAVRLTATLADVDPLFDGTLERDGRSIDPDLVHFACHGQVDPNPRFNGIVLNEGSARLDDLYVRGNRMQRPFVFLNACQVGQVTELLETSGLATAFLRTGASGFVAPLWNVDDTVAKETALGFYRAALDERVPVAEVMRRRRASFDPSAATPEPTHLAYVYYGHPNLVLAHAG